MFLLKVWKFKLNFIYSRNYIRPLLHRIKIDPRLWTPEWIEIPSVVSDIKYTGKRTDGRTSTTP
jgi:hypothetical protein